MHITKLRKVGGSVMVAVPPALLDILSLSSGSTVGLTISDGRILIEPNVAPRYTLDELLSQCDPDAPRPEEDQAWMDTPTVGREV